MITTVAQLQLHNSVPIPRHTVWKTLTNNQEQHHDLVMMFVCDLLYIIIIFKSCALAQVGLELKMVCGRC